jgi:hypothetical protein
MGGGRGVNMADIELVIKIQQKMYEYALNDLLCGSTALCKAIKNGTPLPKEHGDLVDRDAINKRFNAIYDELVALSNQPTHKELLDKLSMCLDTEIPIIEADKGE